MMSACATSLARYMQLHGYCIKSGAPSRLTQSVQHDGVGILFMREGVCRFRADDWSATLTPHTGVVFDNRIEHSATYVNSRIGRTVVHLSRDIVSTSACERLLNQCESRLKGTRVQGFRFPTPDAEVRFHWAVSHLGALLERPTSREAVLHLVGLIFSEMQPYNFENVLPPLLKDVIEYMKQHLHLDSTISEVAEKAYCSESHLRRIFSQYLGDSPRNYWLRLKIDHALQMLRAGEAVEDAVRATGFSSRRGFEKAFSRLVGMSPNEFVRMSRNTWQDKSGLLAHGSLVSYECDNQ